MGVSTTSAPCHGKNARKILLCSNHSAQMELKEKTLTYSYIIILTTTTTTTTTIHWQGILLIMETLREVVIIIIIIIIIIITLWSS